MNKRRIGESFATVRSGTVTRMNGRAAFALLIAVACTPARSHSSNPPPPPGGLTTIANCSFATLDGPFLAIDAGGAATTTAAAATFTLEVIDATGLADGAHVPVRTGDGHYLAPAPGAPTPPATFPPAPDPPPIHP